MDVSGGVVPVGLFLSGAVTGYVAGTFFAGRLDVAEAIALLVAMLWTLSMVAQTILPYHRTSAGLHTVMLAAASYLFGTELVPQRDGGGGAQ